MSFRRLAQLVETVRSLRDEVDGLLVEREGDLTDELYNQLMEMDVDDAYLPTGEAELMEWVSRAQAVIAEARKCLSRLTATPHSGVSDDALAALAARFNRK